MFGKLNESGIPNCFCVEGVESVECGPVRPLAAVLVEPLIRGKVKDSDAWSKHSQVVCAKTFFLTVGHSSFSVHF